MGCGASTAASQAKAEAAQPVKPRIAPDPPPAAPTLPPLSTSETSSASTQGQAEPETSNLPNGEKVTEADDELPQLAKRPSLSSGKFSARVVLWWKCFLHKDPRRQILQYFQPGDVRGPHGYLAARGLRPDGPPSRCDGSK